VSWLLRMHHTAKILKVSYSAIFYSKGGSELCFENASRSCNSPKPVVQRWSTVNAVASCISRMHRTAQILKVSNSAIFCGKRSCELYFENASRSQNSTKPVV